MLYFTILSLTSKGKEPAQEVVQFLVTQEAWTKAQIAQHAPEDPSTPQKVSTFCANTFFVYARMLYKIVS